MKTGRVYRIFADDTDKTYIGSTVQSLKARMWTHKTNYNRNGSCSSKIIMKNENPKIILLEEVSYEHIIDLRKRERYYIELEGDKCVNICLPAQTQPERSKRYRDKHLEEINEYMKTYREINKDDISQHNKQYMVEYSKKNHDKIFAPNQCECGGTYIHKHKNRHFNSKKHLTYENKISLK